MTRTVKIMSAVDTFKDIYNGPFTQYLKVSKKIGGTIFEQSKLFDVLFLLEINLVSIRKRFKKPIHEQDLNVFLDPITIQIEKVKKINVQYSMSPYKDHLNLISQSTDIFAWMKHTNTKEFLINFNKTITPFIDKIRHQLLKYSMNHADWLYAWNCCLEDMDYFLSTYFKNGLTWSGTEKLPANISLGDMLNVSKNVQHIKLFKEINRGSNIINILKPVENVNDEAETDDG